LATMMVPFPVTMVPTFTLFKWLGWVGSFKPLWVPAYLGSAFAIFLLRQFFRTIPNDLSEAARIDGASEFRVFADIVLPLARPAVTVIALFTFMGTWNDFLGPLIFLTDQNTFTLSLGLQAYQTQHGGTPWNLLMAASLLVILPIVVVFFFAQETFVHGIATSGFK
ncbi:MAG: carbohydrate ABC transporter permease, partial [Nitrospirae bacterium]|nr:carbohydrate ABC transporter permease [Fimbriimonadaceae bacterium]